jgi:hypothetical protein
VSTHILFCLVINHGSIKGNPILNTHIVQSATCHDKQLQNSNLLLVYLLGLKQEAPSALEDTECLLYNLPRPAVAQVETSLFGGVCRGLKIGFDHSLEQVLLT